MAKIAIGLLGHLRVAVGGHVLTDLYSDKVRALIAYLAAESGFPHRRESLIGLLWPDYPEHSARQSLSQALFALRRAIRQADPSTDIPWLIATRETIELSPGPGCWIDVVELEALVDACRAHLYPDPAECPACAKRLERVVDLYEGEFLAGFSLPDSAAFEEWLLVRRGHSRREAVEALAALAAQGERRGDFAAALDHARRWVELEPLDERGHRQVMRLLALAGQHASALAHYESCRRVLMMELGVEPDTRTTALHEQIRDGSFFRRAARPLDLSVRSPPFLSQPERHQAPLFVAREREMAQLHTYLDAALKGRAHFAMVTGEAGCGKTALVQEFARRAQCRYPDLVVASGRCNAYSGIGDPYLAFREILAQLGGEVESRWWAGAISRDEATRLWGLLPHTCLALVESGPDLVSTFIDGDALLARAEDAARPDAAWLGDLRELVDRRRARLGGDVQQPSLFQQTTAVLQRLARVHPLLLILEDLHWADAGSLSLLFHMGAHLSSERIIVVGACRPGVLGRGHGADPVNARHPLESVFHELERRFGEIIVDLDQADGPGFVSALLDAEPNTLDDAFRVALYRQVGGNALFAAEMLQSMRERGNLVRDAEGRWGMNSAVHWDRLPARVEAVIAERIAALPTTLQEALRVGSVEGETFTIEVVAQVLGLEPLSLVREIGAAEAPRHGLVQAVGANRARGRPISTYRFRHILIQQRLYDGIDRPERVYLHEAIGDALLALHGGDDDEAAAKRRHAHPVAVQLARHYEEAGDIKRAIAWLRRADDRAEHLGAYAESARHFARGLDLCARLPAGQERDTARLPLLLGSAVVVALRSGNTTPELFPIVEEALTIAERMHDAVCCIRALVLLVERHLDRAEFPRAQEAAEEMLAWARRAEDDGLITWALSEYAKVCLNLGNYRQAVQALEPVLNAWDATDPDALHGTLVWIPHNTVRMFLMAALPLAALGHLDQALARLRDALNEARKEDLTLGLCWVSGVAAMVYLQRREYEQALRWAQDFGQRAARSGIASWVTLSASLEGAALAHLGEVSAGIAKARDGLARWLAADQANSPGFFLGLADCYLVAERAEDALEAAESGLAACAELGHGMWLAVLHLLRGQALLLLDPPDVARAEAAMLDAIGVARRQEARLYELRATVALARLWQGQGKLAEARELMQPVYDWFTEGFDIPDLVEARVLLAELAP